MRRPSQIKGACIRRCRDNGQTVAFVEWTNGERTFGSEPEGDPILGYRRDRGHMEALFARCVREGIEIRRETW